MARHGKSWLARNAKAIAVAGVMIGALAGLSSFAKNIFDMYQGWPTKPGIEVVFEDRWHEFVNPVLVAQVDAYRKFAKARQDKNIHWPKYPIWNYAFGVDYYRQGEGDGKRQTEWHSCIDPGRKHRLCSKSPEYRRDHHLHRKDWKG